MTISEFIWGLIWFTAFSVAVAAIVIMAKSIWKDCREIGYRVKRVVSRWYAWRKDRENRKIGERILDKMSTFRLRRLFEEELECVEALEKYDVLAECDYAYGKCFTCARETSILFGDLTFKTCDICTEKVDLKEWYAKKFPPEVECNYALGKCYTCARKDWKNTMEKLSERVALSDVGRRMLGLPDLPNDLKYTIKE